VPGSSPHDAFQKFINPLQRAISCVTPVVFDRRGDDRPFIEHPLTLDEGQPVSVRRNPGRPALAVRITQRYQIVRAAGRRGPWKVQTVGYWYTLEDREGQEIIAYHWHPAETPHILYPHMHAEQGGNGLIELQKAHLPTGRIAVEEFLRLLIETFAVRPRRVDWNRILRETQAEFEKWRTWPRTEE
jgi:hypothetical protein